MAYSPKIIIILATIFVCLFPTSSQAESVKIAVVDVDKILSESSAGTSIQKQLKTRRESFQKEFSAREDNLMASQKLLMSQKNDLGAEDFAKKRQDFEKQLLETKSLFQKRRNALDKGLGNALSELRKSIIQVTAEVADDKGYQIVVTRDSVVIVEKEMDITDVVLSKLNAKVSNIPLDLE